MRCGPSHPRLHHVRRTDHSSTNPSKFSPSAPLQRVTTTRSTGGDTVEDTEDAGRAGRATAATGDRERRARLGIDVLSNRADLISAGDALVAVDVPAGVDPANVRVTDDGRDVTSAFALRAERPLRGPRHRPRRSARNVLTRARARRRPRRAHHGHEPPERRPGLLRPAGPAVGLPGDARSTRSATSPRPTSSSTSLDDGAVRGLRPGQPAVRRRDDHDRPGQDGPVHRPRRDRLPGPRPVQDRGPLRPVEAVGAVGAAGRVEPQAADHPRRELRDRAPGRRPATGDVR